MYRKRCDCTSAVWDWQDFHDRPSALSKPGDLQKPVARRRPLCRLCYTLHISRSSVIHPAVSRLLLLLLSPPCIVAGRHSADSLSLSCTSAILPVFTLRCFVCCCCYYHHVGMWSRQTSSRPSPPLLNALLLVLFPPEGAHSWHVEGCVEAARDLRRLWERD